MRLGRPSIWGWAWACAVADWVVSNTLRTRIRKASQDNSDSESANLPKADSATAIRPKKESNQEEMVYADEVEQLLSPEELAILQQNEAPNLDKMSMEKWNPLHTLALTGQIKFMDSLLTNGFDIDAVDKGALMAKMCRSL
ncbi:ankyrin repeat domain-containing protein EMB506, chloroplastic [Tanacetum coccineum]